MGCDDGALVKTVREGYLTSTASSFRVLATFKIDCFVAYMNVGLLVASFWSGFGPKNENGETSVTNTTKMAT